MLEPKSFFRNDFNISSRLYQFVSTILELSQKSSNHLQGTILYDFGSDILNYLILVVFDDLGIAVEPGDFIGHLRPNKHCSVFEISSGLR